jgi:hypothetical protein
VGLPPIDRLARMLALGRLPRRALLAALAAAATWLRSREAATAPGGCVPAGGYCGVWVGCCPGLVCRVPYTNPNAGLCVPGSDVTGAGMVMVGPAGPITVPAGTAAPTPTSGPKPTKAPKPTRTPKNRSGTYALDIVLTCTSTPERTRVHNTGNRPVRIMQVQVGESDSPRQIFTNGAVPEWDAAATIDGDDRISIWSAEADPPEAHVLTFADALFPDDATDLSLRVVVEKLDENGNSVTDGGEFLEFEAYCDGNDSRLVGPYTGQRVRVATTERRRRSDHRRGRSPRRRNSGGGA